MTFESRLPSRDCNRKVERSGEVGGKGIQIIQCQNERMRRRVVVYTFHWYCDRNYCSGVMKLVPAITTATGKKRQKLAIHWRNIESKM